MGNFEAAVKVTNESFPQSRASGRCAAVDRVTAADQDVWQERVVELLPFYVTWVGIQVQIVQVRLK